MEEMGWEAKWESLKVFDKMPLALPLFEVAYKVFDKMSPPFVFVWSFPQSVWQMSYQDHALDSVGYRPLQVKNCMCVSSFPRSKFFSILSFKQQFVFLVESTKCQV